MPDIIYMHSQKVGGIQLILRDPIQDLIEKYKHQELRVSNG